MGNDATLVTALLGRLATASGPWNTRLLLSQRRYMTDLLGRSGMAELSDYHSLDLAYAVNRLCQFMHSVTTETLGLVKRVLRYIKGTLDYGLWLSPSSSTSIHAYSDSDWAGFPIDRKSTSGFAVYLGTNLILALQETTYRCTLIHRGGV
ncbi:PREDICTED: uncharacterized protein LOC109154861 [Ipomoea nil]|uniref:uncharacterized protein LOC109154861 n=1 Tax=Ipomoea nil TaxID=35883 RepID=UPI000901DFC3|nr:PREDICTED: uncharacterized protein LOC109154861 [Ipomoea nil]